MLLTSGGRLGKNPIQVRDEQINLLSSRAASASPKSQPPPRQQRQNPTIFPYSYPWDVTHEEPLYPKKKCFNKRKTIVLRMAVRIHYRHGLLHSLNRQKTVLPHSKLQQRYTQNEQVTQKHSKQTAYFFSPSVTGQAWRRPELEHPRARCFLLDNGFITGIDISHLLKNTKKL